MFNLSVLPSNAWSFLGSNKMLYLERETRKCWFLLLLVSPFPSSPCAFLWQVAQQRAALLFHFIRGPPKRSWLSR